MASPCYQQAYTYYISYYRTATAEQLEMLKERTRRAVMAYSYSRDVQQWAAGKIAAIDKLLGKAGAKASAQSGETEQQHF